MEDSLVAFMGLTGSGKSSLINLLLGEDKAKVGNDILSETSTVSSYTLHHQGKKIILVGTPGFDDTKRSDTEVLRELYQWLKATYTDKQLNAIFYLHNITDNRMRGSAVKSSYMFKKLCGEGFYPNILLGTNFWRIVKPFATAEAEAREIQLKSEDTFWKAMISGGSRVSRIPNTRAEALKLLSEMAVKPAKVLHVQTEAVEQGRAFENTTAQDSLDMEAAAARKRRKQELEALAKQAQKAREEAAAQAERDRAEKQRKLDEERRKTQRISDARLKAEREHREKVAAAQKDQERMAEREKELEAAMRKLKIVTARKEKWDAYHEKIQRQLSRLQIWEVDPNVYRTQTTAYRLTCDNCMENIGYGKYWHCAICYGGDFDLCQPCHSAPDVFCDGSGHFLNLEERFQGDTQGNCPRIMNPIKRGQAITCSSCLGRCTEVYFHCCYCDNDNYDLCVDCLVRKKYAGCRHQVDLCTLYIA